MKKIFLDELYVVSEKIAYNSNFQGTIFRVELSDLSDGVYQGDEQVDNVKSLAVMSLMKRQTLFSEKTIDEFCKSVPKLKKSLFVRLINFPKKITKILANELEKTEYMSTFILDDSVKFLCFGTQKTMLEWAKDQDIEMFSISPIAIQEISTINPAFVVKTKHFIVFSNQEYNKFLVCSMINQEKRLHDSSS